MIKESFAQKGFHVHVGTSVSKLTILSVAVRYFISVLPKELAVNISLPGFTTGNPTQST